MSFQTRLLSAVSLLALLGGCAVGPDFKKPDAPAVSAYTPTPLANPSATPGVVAGDAQTFQQAADIGGDWWTAFHSPALTALIEQSLKNNSDLKAAEATLRQARENAIAQKGAFYPQVAASFAASHQENPASLAPVPSNNSLQYDLFTPEVTVSYAPDIWGLTRRTVESYTAQADAARYQMLAAYTTLVNNVIATAVEEAATHAQIESTGQMIAAEKKSLEILQYQKDKGYASGLDLAQQISALATAQATLPPLVKQEAQYHDLLAVLIGKFPAETPPESLKLSDLTLPADLPVSLPATLVTQRPDVMQAESNLHAASAQIGIAVANRLPNVALSANAGSTALVLNQLLQPGTEFWTVAGGLTAPLFEGGTLLHQERAARAAFDASAAQYRSTVLGAVQNVADTLVALQQDAEAVKSASAADAAAKKTLDITQYQLKDGYSNTLGLLTAEQAYQQAEVTLLTVQSARFADTAALFQALGGGWWHRDDLTDQNANNGNATKMVELKNIIALGALLLVAGCGPKSNPAPPQGSNVTLTAAQKARLQLYTVQAGSYRREVDTSGTVDFDNNQSTQVLAPFGGMVARLIVEQGAQVKKGDALASVVSPDFSAAVGAYRKAVVNAQNLRRLADIDKDLLAHSGVSQKEADQAESDATGAESDRDAALAALEAQNVDPEVISAAQSGKSTARAEGIIRSPLSGTVVEKLVSPGQNITANTTPVFTVADLSKVWVMAHVFDSDIGSVHQGDTAQIISAGHMMSGMVDNVGAEVDPNTRSVAVRIVVDNPGDYLKRQMYVQVNIFSQQEVRGILAPVSAILRDEDNLPFVYVVQADGSFARQRVTLGYRGGNQYDIPEGLRPGQQIVADGGIFVQFMQQQ